MPWETIDEFEQARDDLDAFRKTLGRVIKTAQDYHDLQEWVAGQEARRAVNARSDGKLTPLPRAVALAALHGTCGVTNKADNYDDLAATISQLTGKPISRMDLKNLKHRGGDPNKLAGGITYLLPADAT